MTQTVQTTGQMTAHELARALLDGPDLPVYVLDQDARAMQEAPVKGINRWGEPRRIAISGWTD
jgi:hypothetical protein